MHVCMYMYTYMYMYIQLDEILFTRKDKKKYEIHIKVSKR